jgi:hypothetical protein
MVSERRQINSHTKRPNYEKIKEGKCPMNDRREIKNLNSKLYRLELKWDDLWKEVENLCDDAFEEMIKFLKGIR